MALQPKHVSAPDARERPKFNLKEIRMFTTNPMFEPTPEQYATAFDLFRKFLVERQGVTAANAARITPPVPGTKTIWFGMIVATRLVSVGAVPAPSSAVTFFDKWAAAALYNSELDMGDRPGMSSKETPHDTLETTTEPFIAALLADLRVKLSAPAAGSAEAYYKGRSDALAEVRRAACSLWIDLIK